MFDLTCGATDSGFDRSDPSRTTTTLYLSVNGRGPIQKGAAHCYSSWPLMLARTWTRRYRSNMTLPSDHRNESGSKPPTLMSPRALLILVVAAGLAYAAYRWEPLATAIPVSVAVALGLHSLVD